MADALPARQKQLFDHAGLLSMPAAERIADRLAEARSQGRDLVIVTVDSLEGEHAERYARGLVRRLDVGGDAGTGVLLLIAKRERRIWIEHARSAPQGGGAVSLRSTGQGVIARAFDAGIEKGIEALLELLWAEAAATFEPDAATKLDPAMTGLVSRRMSRREGGDLSGVGLFAILATVVGPLARGPLRRRSGGAPRRRGSALLLLGETLGRPVRSAACGPTVGNEPGAGAAPNQSGANPPWAA